jgi:UDP-glucose 4-epimerase
LRILLTGTSSFTGYWFAEALVGDGHYVLAPLRGALDCKNDQERAVRLRRLNGKIELIAHAPFGSPRFLDAISATNIDVLCHHGAEVGDHRNPDFDIPGTVARNTLNLTTVLRAMTKRGLQGVVLTGSFFEHNEGVGSQPLVAFSAYGLSKGLTADVVRHRCHEIGLAYGKFVIPHPFGPFEQPRLGAYLARTWMSGGVAQIKTPAYVRDNIHVSLLAAAYKRFVGETLGAPLVRKLNPSGYVETQGAFVDRLARELGRRLGLECRVELMEQRDFPEPLVRLNTQPATLYAKGWSEEQAWDEYSRLFGNGLAA